MAFENTSIISIIASSLTRAQYEYYEMTGRKGFQEVAKTIPEKFLEVAAARSCYEHLRGSQYYIIQEFQFSRLNEAAKNFYGISNCRKFENDTRRIDVVVKNHGGGIEAILEIKRKISSSGLHQVRDIARLRDIKEYFSERVGVNIDALFAYPITLNFADEDDFKEEIDSNKYDAKEIFGDRYSMSVGEYRIRFPDEDFYFSFGAVCGRV